MTENENPQKVTVFLPPVVSVLTSKRIQHATLDFVHCTRWLLDLVTCHDFKVRDKHLFHAMLQWHATAQQWFHASFSDNDPAASDIPKVGSKMTQVANIFGLGAESKKCPLECPCSASVFVAMVKRASESLKEIARVVEADVADNEGSTTNKEAKKILKECRMCSITTSLAFDNDFMDVPGAAIVADRSRICTRFTDQELVEIVSLRIKDRLCGTQEAGDNVPPKAKYKFEKLRS